MENNKTCPSCNHIADEEDRFCSKCGVQIEPQPSFIYNTYVSGQQISGEQREMKDFIGNEAEYYMDKFETMTVLEKRTTWNWAAFFLSPMWCFYRKQYILGLMMIVLLMSTTLVEGARQLLGLIFSIFMGATGNFFYKTYVEKHLKIASELTAEERLNYYEKKGGTSYLAVFVGLCCVFLFSFIVVKLF